jgi:hypothetical protein
MDNFKEIRQTRVALVAGGKHDDFETAREMGKIIIENCQGSKAYVVRKAIHGWDLQYPELFAQGVRAWIEGSTMPEEYEELT